MVQQLYCILLFERPHVDLNLNFYFQGRVAAVAVVLVEMVARVVVYLMDQYTTVTVPMDTVENNVKQVSELL